MKHPAPIRLLFASLLLPAAIAVADEYGASTDAHVHGEASLQLGLEGRELFMELTSPAMNFLGFERLPASDEERARAAELKQRLQQADAVLAIPAAAGCRLTAVEVEGEVFAVPKAPEQAGAHGHTHGHEHGDKDKDQQKSKHEHAHKRRHDEGSKHGHGHGHGHGEEHGHKHKHDHDHSHGHSDIHASYTLSCEQPQALRRIEASLFTLAPGLERLRVQWITEQDQGATTLTPGRHGLRW